MSKAMERAQIISTDSFSDKLIYLDLPHVLRSRVADLEATLGDLRWHLVAIHDFNPPRSMNKRMLARMHLALHALQAFPEGINETSRDIGRTE